MKKAERRAQLLRIARDIVAADGPEALSMNALAECAEVTKPVVYSHFANSAQVIVALMDEHYESMRKYVREATESAGTVDEYISQLLDSSFEFERSNTLPVHKIINSYSSSDEVNRAFERYRGVMKKYWQTLLEQQGVPRNVAEIAAFGFACMVSETTAAYAVRPRSQKLARETLKGTVLATITAFSTRPTTARPEVHASSYAARPAPKARHPNETRGRR